MREEGAGRPRHAPGPDGPWQGVCADLDARGHAVVYAMWEEWLPSLPALPGGSVLGAPGPHRLLGEDRRRWLRIVDPSVRNRFAASRALLRYAAAARLRTDPASLELAYEAHGRPYLSGFGNRLDVSITHTGSLIAVGLSTRGRIGVDAEPGDRRIHEGTVLSRLCTAAERAAVTALPADERRAELLRLWTLKEAYVKALGHGLRLGLSGFGVSPEDGRLLAPDGSPAVGGEWAFSTCEVFGRFVVSVARYGSGAGGPARLRARRAATSTGS